MFADIQWISAHKNVDYLLKITLST